MTQEEVRVGFKHLSNLLIKKQLPTRSGEMRFASPDEFMLMDMVKDNDVIRYNFKHRDSRQYVHVNVIYFGSMSGITVSELELIIPEGNVFDYMPVFGFKK